SMRGARVLRAAGRFIGACALAVALVIALVIVSLRFINPPASSFTLQENWLGDDAGGWVSFQWRPLEAISKQMILAVVAAEDQRFFQHHGLDFIELRNSLREASASRTARPRGASTITQQTAKNLFLWSGRSYPRKLLEAALALAIDFAWGKRRTLEVYLNIVQFGPGVYGIERASSHFFDKPASRLTRHEAARLAAVLPAPNLRSPRDADAATERRRQWILRQMRALGGVSFLRRLD
ncbi:MAG: monofunctional biosynthetic peptidoglycan transglycosylase, partial [bacterium]